MLKVNQGSLYSALYRLENQELVESSWGISPEGRRAKFYELTRQGRAVFDEEEKSWRLFAGAVEQILSA